MRPSLRQFAAWLAGMWAGLIAGVGFVAAPALFATVPRSDAGRAAARLFAVDASIGLAAGALMLVVALRLARDAAGEGAARLSVDTMLVLGAVFCIVAGHYGVQPMMAVAARGEPGASFATLHIAGAAFFGVKFVVVALLAWRLTGRQR